MKKFYLVLGTVICLVLFALFTTKVLAAPSCFGDSQGFPYGFICPRSNNDTSNFHLSYQDGIYSGTDIPQDGIPNNYSDSNEYVQIPDDGGTISFSANFYASNSPKNSAGGDAGPNSVLVWATIDMLNTTGTVSAVTPGGATGNCPGASGLPGVAPGVVYNFWSNPPDPDNSPAAYTNYHNGNYQSDDLGYENCGNQGAMVYWKDQNPTPGNWYAYNFNIKLNPNQVNRAICVRTNVSVSFDNFNNYFPGGGNNYKDINHQANHVAKQTKRECFHLVKSCDCNCSNTCPPQGNLDFTADCHIVYFTSLSDPNIAGPLHYWGIVYQRNPDGSAGAQAAVIDGTGTTGSAYDYYSQPPFNSPPEDFQNYGWVIDIGYIDSTGTFGNVKRHVVDPFDQGGPCYTAHCTSAVISRNPGRPSSFSGGQVLTNSTFDVTVTYHNDQPGYSTDYLPSQLHDYNNNLYNLTGTASYGSGPQMRIAIGRDIPKQEDFQVTFRNLTASSGVSSTPFDTYPDYYGMFPIGAGCRLNIDTFEQFTLKPGASVNFVNGGEDPTDVNYKTTIKNSSSSYTINGPPPPSTVSKFTFQRFGMASPVLRAGPSTNNGGWPPGTRQAWSGSGGMTLPAQAGDYYCAQIDLTAYNRGYVGPGGQVTGQTLDPAAFGVTYYYDCKHVANEPLFKVYNGGISAGGEFSVVPTVPPNSCKGASADDGTLAGWNNNMNLNYNFGTGTQLSSLAVLKITGVASAQTVTSRPPTELSFANTAGLLPADSTDPDSPNIGGVFSTNYAHCLIDPTQPTTGTTTLNSGVLNNLASRNGSFSRPNNLRINGGNNIPPGSNISIFVNGDVYIDSDITYDLSSPWSLANVPSFILNVTGNIYIDPSVTRLDGIYIAKKRNAAHPGTIYTCGKTAGPNFIQLKEPPDNLYATCNKQLVVNGVFVADNIKLMRTLGSLRNEKQGSTSGPPGCVNLGAALVYTQSCAAEVFIFQPELFLSHPAISPPAGGSQTYDSSSSLPPVL